MRLWHLTPDAPRAPMRVSPGARVALHIGTWPIAPGQSVCVSFRVARADGTGDQGRVDAAWQRNEGANSYWRADIGPFAHGDRVQYRVQGHGPGGDSTGPATGFRVGAKFYLALLWHQHQPLYKDTAHPGPKSSYRQPWVRLHALRDYYSMAALVAEHPGVHLTINLTPSLLWQLEDYLERGATDRALELTLKPAETLSAAEQAEMLGGFFDAHWHNQIFPYPRYKELFNQRVAAQPFSAQDLRDLAMWFHLAWFGQEFREGDVRFATGENVSVQGFVRQGHGFNHSDIEAMVAEQYKVMRAVVPLHRSLQERGQIEVATTPFYHPILPLLVDTDRATIDRPGAQYPPRFHHPEDADAQVRLAVAYYQRLFGRPPRGMWPAEGAVAQFVVPIFARHGLRWIATDRGVLARSGRWGYDVDNPEVLCQPYRAQEQGRSLSVFFRDSELSDAIGFHYQAYGDYGQAAAEFLQQIKERFADRLTDAADPVLTVILDGDNAWGAYREDARPFLHALYGLLERDTEIETVTFAEYLDGDPARGLAAHPAVEQQQVHDLFTGSWINEWGSAPGVDLGTWIGEDEENRAWSMLGETRAALARVGATPASAAAAFEALYMAEGSDWFWWFGEDQDSGNDVEFDELFRMHLANVYRAIGVEPPAMLARHIVPHAVVWTFTQPAARVQRGDRLVIRTNCAGELTWHIDDGASQTAPLAPIGGVMAGVRRYHLVLGPFSAEAREVRFRFRCTHPGCSGDDVCCRGHEYRVAIA